VKERVAELLGAQPLEWMPRTGGYSTADRFTVTLDDGRTVFVKSAEAPHLAAWLRREHEVYAHVEGSFMPELIAFDDDGVRPILVIEDLSRAEWEPRWTPDRVDRVRSALRELNGCAPPPNTEPVRVAHAGLFGRWRDVADDPEPFLSVGLRPEAWLDEHLPALLELGDGSAADGDDVLHLDVRSDNLCFDGDRVVLVDWNWLTIGNRDLDVAAWLPSLHSEGGPPPWDVLPDGARLAAIIGGVWAAVVGLPPPETAPAVREGQRTQLAVVLDWLDRELS
jgi:hypothetical protein